MAKLRCMCLSANRKISTSLSSCMLNRMVVERRPVNVPCHPMTICLALIPLRCIKPKVSSVNLISFLIKAPSAVIVFQTLCQTVASMEDATALVRILAESKHCWSFMKWPCMCCEGEATPCQLLSAGPGLHLGVQPEWIM